MSVVEAPPKATAVASDLSSKTVVVRAAAVGRLQALDVLRGLAIVVMLLVMNPGPTSDLPRQLRHATWHGLTVADLAFPLFLFAVGVSMTLSSRGSDRRHALNRALVLLGCGVLLASLKHEGIGVTGVLQHIAGAYLLAFGVLQLPRRSQVLVAAGMLLLVWAGFAGYAAWAGPGGDPWAEGGTLAHAVDGSIFGGFTSEGTLQTAASAVTVLGGAFAGRWIGRLPDLESPTVLVRIIGTRAVGLLVLGLALAVVVPVNKRLWTPSFTLVTLAIAFGLLATTIWLCDILRVRRPTAPLAHMGANPFVVYVVSMAVLFSLRNYGTALTPDVALLGSPTVGALAYAGVWTTLWWLFAFVLHRRRIFVRI